MNAHTAGVKRCLFAIINWIKDHKSYFIAVLLVVLLYFILVPRCIFRDPLSAVITDRNGILLGARVAGDGQWRFPGTGFVPEKVEIATLAFEDRYFYHHPGINPVSIIRAIVRNIKAGYVVSGGSTITMQTIRIFRKGKPRSVREKLLEMLMATRLELEKSKREILSLYTVHAPYGGNVVGLEAAAWRYFGTTGDQLTWAQAATLAVLPNSPALVHPGRNREILLVKRNRLLQKLYERGFIDQITLTTAMAETIPDAPNPMPLLAPHLLNRLSYAQPESVIQTTLDAALQEAVTRLVEMHHNKLRYNQIHNAAALIIEVETGNVLAYTGNCGYPLEKDHSNEVDVISAPRSTGSLLKPILYAAMIDDGKLLPSGLVADIPVNLEGFSPKNFDGQYEGAVPAERALSQSLNVPAVQLLKKYGVERFHLLLQHLGMNTVNKPAAHYGLSLILGGAEGTLGDMTNVYASLSRVLNHYGETGKYYSHDFRQPYFQTGQTPQGKVNKQAEVLNASSIWAAYEAMLEVNRPEEESGWQHFASSRKIAWKTGTSFGYRDAWAIGTSSRYVVGVWIGNADGEGRPGLTGIAVAAPLLFDIFGLLPDAPWFKPPVDELVPALVCRQSGFLAGQYCNDRDTVKIPYTGSRSPVCPYHKLVHLSGDLQFRVTSDCCPVDSMKHVSWFVLPPVQEWFFRKYHADYRKLPEFRAGCEPSGLRSMDLVYPYPGIKVFIPREIKGEKSRVVFEAVHNDADATIYWHIDDQYISSTRYIHQVELLPSPGKHQIYLTDDKGEELVRTFEVMGQE